MPALAHPNRTRWHQAIQSCKSVSFLGTLVLLGLRDLGSLLPTVQARPVGKAIDAERKLTASEVQLAPASGGFKGGTHRHIQTHEATKRFHPHHPGT